MSSPVSPTRRGALAALAVRPADLAVIAGRLADGSDGFAAARQLRHCQSGLKVLFTASAGFPPAAGGLNDGYVVTRPFDRRRFLGSVLELVARGEADAGDRRAAELGLVEAELACLASRFAAAKRTGARGQSQHLAYRIRDAVAARQAWLLSAAAPDAGPLGRIAGRLAAAPAPPFQLHLDHRQHVGGAVFTAQGRQILGVERLGRVVDRRAQRRGQLVEHRHQLAQQRTAIGPVAHLHHRRVMYRRSRSVRRIATKRIVRTRLASFRECFIR